MMLMIDGVNWGEKVLVDNLHLVANLVVKNAVETQNSKKHYYPIGTEYSYEAEIYRGESMTDAEWEDFFLKLCEPVDFHDVELPFGLNGKQSFRAHIETVEKDLEDYVYGMFRWSNHVTVTFTPEEPQRRAE